MLHAVSEYGSLAGQQVSFPMLGTDAHLERTLPHRPWEILAQVSLPFAVPKACQSHPLWRTIEGVSQCKTNKKVFP